MKLQRIFSAFLLVALAGCGDDPLAISQEAHRAQLLEWRSQREASLSSETGWLSLVGLCWLEPGSNNIGRSVDNACHVDSPAMPEQLGTFLLEGDRITFMPHGDHLVTSEGRDISKIAMRSDHQPDTTMLAHDSLRFYVIERFGEVGVRVRDLDSPARRSFEGLDYFPVNMTWRKIARFEPWEAPKEIPIINILGMRDGMRSPGELVFEHDGREFRLTALADESDDEWFVMVADATSGRTTYGAGRYIYVEPPRDGRTVLDFNRIYNPPCAFTALATCPLPPVSNRLDLAITAGEKDHHSETGWKVDGSSTGD